jgi:hypothetical protein
MTYQIRTMRQQGLIVLLLLNGRNNKADKHANMWRRQIRLYQIRHAIVNTIPEIAMLVEQEMRKSRKKIAL